MILLKIEVRKNSTGERRVYFSEECLGHEVEEVKKWYWKGICLCDRPSENYGHEFTTEERIELIEKVPEVLF